MNGGDWVAMKSDCVNAPGVLSPPVKDFWSSQGKREGDGAPRGQQVFLFLIPLPQHIVRETSVAQQLKDESLVLFPGRVCKTKCHSFFIEL